MNRAEMTAIIEGVIDAQPHARRLYPDLYAEEVADAIIAAQGDEYAEFHVRKDAPDTSKAISEKIRAGSLQADVLNLFVNLAYTSTMGGACDDDIEVALGRSHQSVSGARNTLVRKGYLVDTGKRRPNRYGNQAILWAWTGKEVKL